jgi:hypothetical protein
MRIMREMGHDAMIDTEEVIVVFNPQAIEVIP